MFSSTNRYTERAHIPPKTLTESDGVVPWRERTAAAQHFVGFVLARPAIQVAYLRYDPSRCFTLAVLLMFGGPKASHPA